jgi:DNA-binding transcriptional MerR regulator
LAPQNPPALANSTQSATVTVTIPDKPLFDPQEVARLVGIKLGRLPKWEEALDGFLSPLITSPLHRQYSRADVEVLSLARRWQQEERCSIATIRARLEQLIASPETISCETPTYEPPSPAAPNPPAAPTPLSSSPSIARTPSGPHWRAHPTFSLDPLSSDPLSSPLQPDPEADNAPSWRARYEELLTRYQAQSRALESLTQRCEQLERALPSSSLDAAAALSSSQDEQRRLSQKLDYQVQYQRKLSRDVRAQLLALIDAIRDF